MPRFGRVLRLGSWNALEHGLTRALDAANTLLLISFISPEILGELVFAQAIVAPMLLLFLTPESVLYREYRAWREEGPDAFGRRLRAFRHFGWLKGIAALLLSMVLAGVTRPSFFSFVWAFALVLTPQLVGADREALRLGLRMRELNRLTLIQKGLLLSATVASLAFFPGRVDSLGALTLLVSVLFVGLARREVVVWLREWDDQAVSPAMAGSARPGGFTSANVIWNSIRTYSFWNHIAFMLANWVQSMDVLVLGTFASAFGVSVREVGIYSSVLKLANLSQALPQALANFSIVWLNQSPSVEISQERMRLRRHSFWLLLLLMVQAGVLFGVSSFVLEVFSRGRWTYAEIEQMRSWLPWMLFGLVGSSTAMLSYQWATVRLSIRALALQVVLPWALMAAVLYGISPWFSGVDGIARANLAVGMLLPFLLFGFLKRSFEPGPGGRLRVQAHRSNHRAGALGAKMKEDHPTGS